jgi:taurine--2-oxoglutarate transaminase
MTGLRKYLLDHGLYVYSHWHTLLIIPPLIITPDELTWGFSIIDRALEITDAVAQ